MGKGIPFWQLWLLCTTLCIFVVSVNQWEKRHNIKTFKQGWKIIKGYFKKS